MPKTVSEAFDLLIGRLVSTEAETASAAQHRASIEARLQSHLGMLRMFRSGSFGHGTSVRGYSDLDYFAVFPAEKAYRNSSYNLGVLRDSLRGRFPSTAVSVRSPAVVVPFGGGAPGERHEITPAWVAESVRGQARYWIPDRADGWMFSTPSAHANWVNQINERHGKRVKGLIRLIKLWNYLQGAGIRSIYLEMRVAEYSALETSIIYSYDLRRSLNHMLQKRLAAMQDPCGLVGYFYPCSDAAKSDALSRLATAISRADKAIEAERAGNIQEAFGWWDRVFAGKFPSYY